MDHNGAAQDNRSGMHHGSMAGATAAPKDETASDIYHLSRGVSPSAKTAASREERIQCSLPSAEALWRSRQKNALKHMERFLKSGRMGFVVDESQMMMHHDSRTTKTLRLLRELGAYRRISSGYPV